MPAKLPRGYSVWASSALLLAAGGLHLGLASRQAGHAPAHAVFFVFSGILEGVSAAILLCWPNRRTVWAGIALSGGMVVLWALTRILAAPFSHAPEEVDAAGILTKLVELAAFAALTFVLVTSSAAARQARAPIISRALAVALSAGAIMLTMGYALEPIFPSLASTAEGEAHAGAHSSKGGAHQATFRVRLTGERAGPYIVDAFTGPTEVGDLFVEVSVRNSAGSALDGLTIGVEVTPVEGGGAPLVGTASADQAQVPGDYAVSLPVPTAGFWDVDVVIQGPEGQASVAFSERVGGTANVAGWVLAGVPLAIAALFVLLFLRTAGRGRG